MSDDLYMPDTPEGRAVEQVVNGLTAGGGVGQISIVRRLTRIGAEAMARLIGHEATAGYLGQLSAEMLRRRGMRHGRNRR